MRYFNRSFTVVPHNIIENKTQKTNLKTPGTIIGENTK